MIKKLISHRGNIDGLNPNLENKPDFIDKAIKLGYDVEIDIRYIENNLFLGHDNPEHPTSLKWLNERKDYLWIHTKNFQALQYLIDFDLKIFFHKEEEHTIINNCKLIWSHNINEANEKSIIPLLSLDDIKNFKFNKKIYGVCSDYVSLIKDLM